jgi:hypothetical protein
MSLENAEAAFAHASRQDPEDALYVLFEGLGELCDEIRDLRQQVAQLRAGLDAGAPPAGQ